MERPRTNQVGTASWRRKRANDDRELSRWLRSEGSTWLIWKCLQFYGAQLCVQLESGWWPDRAVLRPAGIVISELDSTYLKRQQRGRNGDLPVAHFPVHLGVNYSGRKRRYERRGSTAVSLDRQRPATGALWPAPGLATAASLQQSEERSDLE